MYRLIYLSLILSPLLIVFTKKIGFILFLLLVIFSPLITGFTVENSKSFLGFPVSPFEFFSIFVWFKFLFFLSKKTFISFNKVHINILLFILWLLFSSILTLFYRTGDPTVLIRNVILLSTVLPISFLFKNKFSEKDLKILNFGFLITFFLALIISIEVGRLTRGVEIYGIYLNKVDKFMNSFIFIIYFCIYLSFKNIKNRIFYLLINLLGILISQGRAFWFATLFLIILYSCLNKNFRLLFIVFLLFIVLYNLIFNFLQQRITLGERSAIYRIEEFKVILENLILEPQSYILGKGLGAVIPLNLAMKFESPYPWWIHNEFLFILYDTGIIGVILYLLCIIELIRYGIKKNRVIFYYALSLIIVSLTTGQFLNLLTGPWLGFLMSQKECNNG
ncbi:MAG: hypothetical protein RMJ67_06755 [Elusimicrobiota bacterium]|nr:hypothetical protein [Endomicrobiia bacterium]MDW8166194.1 hypothetical protein [Elusimicrobiota bacterium]